MFMRIFSSCARAFSDVVSDRSVRLSDEMVPASRALFCLSRRSRRCMLRVERAGCLGAAAAAAAAAAAVAGASLCEDIVSWTSGVGRELMRIDEGGHRKELNEPPVKGGRTATRLWWLVGSMLLVVSRDVGVGTQKARRSPGWRFK